MTQSVDSRPLATTDDFCEFAGVTKGHAAQMRYAGTGPKFVKITGRQVRYRWSDIEEWLESRTRNRTDDPPCRRRGLHNAHSRSSRTRPESEHSAGSRIGLVLTVPP